MLVFAIILFVLIGLYVVIGSIRQKKLLINKFVIFLAVIAIGLIFINNHFESNSDTSQTSQPYQKISPSFQDAPYILPTQSRDYYVAAFLKDESGITLTKWYYYDSRKWKVQDNPLPFPKSLYGELTPIKRNSGG